MGSPDLTRPLEVFNCNEQFEWRFESYSFVLICVEFQGIADSVSES